MSKSSAIDEKVLGFFSKRPVNLKFESFKSGISSVHPRTELDLEPLNKNSHLYMQYIYVYMQVQVCVCVPDCCSETLYGKKKSEVDER